MSTNIFITGVSRGIGFELAKQALEKGAKVFGTARSPQDSDALNQLQHKYEKNFFVASLDLTVHDLPHQLEKLASHLSEIDVLINNAGVYREGETADDFAQSFRTNSLAPFLVTKTLLPLLKKGKHPRAIQISSLMGSIGDNTKGGAYAYRASKAALNMITKTLSIEHPWLTTVVLHPGWVKTDMGGASAPTEVVDSARGIWKVVGDLAPAKTGQFFDFTGKPLAW